MKRTIRFKIVSYVLLIVIIGFGIVSLIIGQRFLEVLKKNVLSAENFRLQQYVEYIEYMQESIDHFAEQLALDEEFQAFFEAEEGLENRWKGYKEARVKNSLRRYLLKREDCNQIDMVFPDGSYYSSGDKMTINYYENEYYRAFKQKGKSRGCAGIQKLGKYRGIGLDERNSLVFIYRMRYIENPNAEAIDIVLFINAEDCFRDFEIEGSSVMAFALLDGEGKSLFEKGEFSDGVGEEAKKAVKEQAEVCANQNTLITVTSEKKDWTVVAEISQALLMQEIRRPLITIIGIMILDCVVLGMTLLLVVLRILKPMETLKQACQAIGTGNLQVRPQIHTGDDFEELGNAYVQMQDDLQKYMDQMLQFEKIKRDMEIDKLILQINPHFIYNTLNVISYMAEEEGCRQIEQFTNAFIALLKDSLAVSKNDGFTTLRQEIINTQNYVILQQIRYESQFDLDIHVSEELLDCYVPNVLLQPVVENAIFHGVLPKDEKGHITVKAEGVAEELYITVTDDGVGMEPELIEELLQEKRLVNDSMRKIGIGNVKSRIEYIYGGAYGIEIHSEVDKGTEVVLRLPCIFEQKRE